jgi:hypothetical protein
LIDLVWAESPTDVGEDTDVSLPAQHHLSQNFPNPFNPRTSIQFALPRRSRVTVTVYNLLGQPVDVLVNGELPAGNHTIHWNGTDYRGKAVSSGVYFYRFEAGDSVETRKMLLLR